jgi:hypothetical protein
MPIGAARLNTLSAQIGGGGPSESYWFTSLTNNDASSPNQFIYSITFDSTNNIIVGGLFENSTILTASMVAKLTNAGALSWARYINTTSTDDFRSVAVDSSDNIFCAGRQQNLQGLLAKYNSSGTLQWQRIQAGASTDQMSGCAVAPDGNVYLVGISNTSGADSLFGAYLAKYNTSGAIQWQRRLGGNSNDFGYSVAVDSNNDPYFVGYYASSGTQGGNDAFVAKYNNSGTLQWRRGFGNASDNRSAQQGGKAIAIDPAGFFYTLYFNQSTLTMSVVKYNVSNAIQWQREITPTYSRSTMQAGGIDLDSSGNIYITGTFTDSSVSPTVNRCIIIKLDSSGNVGYRKHFHHATATISRDIKVRSGVLAVAGHGISLSGGSNQPFVMKLPLDGSVNWTYSMGGSNFVLENTTDYTISTSTYTDFSANVGLDNYNITMSESAGSGSTGTAAISSTVQTIS